MKLVIENLLLTHPKYNSGWRRPDNKNLATGVRELKDILNYIL